MLQVVKEENEQFRRMPQDIREKKEAKRVESSKRQLKFPKDVCYACKQVGHLVKQCPSNTRYNCQGKGHFACDCVKKQSW